MPALCLQDTLQARQTSDALEAVHTATNTVQMPQTKAAHSPMMAPRANVAMLAKQDAQLPVCMTRCIAVMLARQDAQTYVGQHSGWLAQQLVGSAHCSSQIGQIIAWLKGMPGKHPAPHDQEPLHHAVSQKSGMIFVAYCCIDK